MRLLVLPAEKRDGDWLGILYRAEFCSNKNNDDSNNNNKTKQHQTNTLLDPGKSKDGLKYFHLRHKLDTANI